MALSFEFVLQELVSYIGHSLQEKKLLYFGMENLDFNFIDPVSIGPVVSYLVCTTYIIITHVFCNTVWKGQKQS